MKAKLIVVGGKATKRSISLTLPTVVGRSQQADLTVGHRTISRRHAELFEKAGLLMIRDLGSLNGTIVDGQRIKEAPLPPGAEFTIGPLTFQVQYEYKSEQSDVPPRPLAKKAGNNGATVAAATDLPDFEPVEEEPTKEAPTTEKMVKQPLAKERGAKEAPAKGVAGNEKQAQPPTGDPFEDLLNELQ